MLNTKNLALAVTIIFVGGCAEAQTVSDTPIKTDQKIVEKIATPAPDEDREKANFPETEIFLFDLNLDDGSKPLSNGRNVSDRPGYDNQPYFTKNSDSFLYSRSDDYQTDIYEYFIGSDEHKRLTHTDKSEFSPTPSPDNSRISFVFERNNSIWHVSRGDEDNPTWTMDIPGIEEPVGYFARNHKTGDILYWSRYGYNVTLTNADKQAYHYVSGHAVPSTPHIIPGTDNFSFVHRLANGQVWIKELNPNTKAVRPLTPIIGQNANYGWAPDGSILMIEGDRLYRNDIDSGQNAESSWEDIADLTELGLKKANRVAISPNGKKLAIVGQALDIQ